ncbi:MAG: aminotransferase class I/II-fold pyridoxal phosphate-dependent enzyme [Pelagibacteraceae bacterium TMED124]|nr:1-aminocyclopropane-1-carboxylate deaminase [Rickettsiales bacterium]RPG16667.1 MAG: aminotransferase class I/II-fold pyridoxal phosphate-dependent enzyme [Pelagibacteraceae bacterium TMED124]|tara:strand:- start:2370 stop:3533 length:1164 start_codon:yes stop_codon:yes gene_type:complete
MNNKFFFPSKRSNIDAFKVMQLLSDASNLENHGKKVYHLELGEPPQLTPLMVKNEVKKLINSNLPGYTPSNGINELRKKISNYYKFKYKLDISHDNIFVTTGSSGAFLLSFISCFDKEKKVGIFNPTYPAYRNILKSLNIEVIEIFSKHSEICKIDFKQIEKFKNLDGLIISNPNNPNGQVFSNKELGYIYNFCCKNNISLISDEIYHGIEFEKPSKSILNFGPKAIVINSFSKYFLMPGWRLGWAIIPDSLRESFLKLSQNLFISSGNIAQYSAVKIFECIDELNDVVKKYSVSREQIYKLLSEIKGLNFIKPDGAFYFYLDITNFNINSEVLTKKILKETGIALTPGTDFDKKFGHRTLRLAFSIDNQKVIEAVNKLKNWFKENY